MDCFTSNQSGNKFVRKSLLTHTIKFCCRHFVQIRVTLTEYQKIIALMYEMSSRGQYDALYIFAKMKTNDAFCYVAHPRTLSKNLFEYCKVVIIIVF